MKVLIQMLLSAKSSVNTYATVTKAKLQLPQKHAMPFHYTQIGCQDITRFFRRLMLTRWRLNANLMWSWTERVVGTWAGRGFEDVRGNNYWRANTSTNL